MKNNREFGNIGETAAAEYLVKKGYKIAARNYYATHGELDIVAVNDVNIVFAEVKTRTNAESSLRYGRPASAVGVPKKEALVLSAQEYLYSNPSPLQPRIDVMEVYLTPLEKNGKTEYRIDDIVVFENAVMSDSRTKYKRKDRF